MTKLRTIARLLALALITLTLPALAQSPSPEAPVAMADALRADGKIWVVAGVFALVTLGTLAYLFRLEGKVAKLERRLRNEE